MIFSILLCIFHLHLVANGANIGIFASSGCYSHDMLARNLADRLASQGHRVTIIQIRVFEFNRTFPEPKSTWDYLSFNTTSPDSDALQLRSQHLMWLRTLPFDADSFDLESVRILDRIHSFHMRACFRAMRNREFMDRLKNLNLNLLVVDYVLNECALGLAYAFMNEVKLVYLSNYPILSSYVENMGVSSNPSFVPAVIGYEKLPMNAARRTANAFLYFLLVGTRHRFYGSAMKTFRMAVNTKLPSLPELESRTLIFATPFEMILDAPRPLVTGLRYFGCEHCTDQQMVVTKGNITQTLSLPLTSTKGYILVSFGTVTRADQIPLQQFVRLFRVFSKFPQYTIVWQLDAPRSYFEDAVLKSLNSTSLPSHIHLFSWIPLKTLLTDPRVTLMVSHGGVTTCIEAVNSGVPVLGVAIHGDQLFNLQRLVEKGVGEFLQVSKLTEQALNEKMTKMIRENERYKQAAVKLRSMLKDYKSLQKESPSVFWLGWAARHFGASGQRRKNSFVQLKHSTNWVIFYNLDVCFAVGFVLALIAHTASGP